VQSDRPTRRAILNRAAQTAAILPALEVSAQEATSLTANAGLDRIVVLPAMTYLRGWAGYGDPKKPAGGPAVTVAWSKDSGPGTVTFADPKAAITTAAFSAPGAYVLKLTATNGHSSATSTVSVRAETAPPPKALSPVHTKSYRLASPLWRARAKALIVNWIPHCIDQINRTDLETGAGGIDNFIEAGKKLRGQPHGHHKGYVFSNAWVHQTVEAMSIALMVDPQGDPEILKAHQKFRDTLEDWIPKILAAQEPDGYLQTAFTLPRLNFRSKQIIDTSGYQHWDPAHRDDHEGYVAGYFLESAINHHVMTGGKDLRLYNAAKKLADCWDANIGPAPKKAWYDGHQQMEQALMRFGRYVNEVEGGGKGDRYIRLGKFLLDCRYTTAPSPRQQQEYDQSHRPVIEQYEAVGHAVRAAYTYSAMADVVVETHDPDYASATRSLWDNIVNRKYYVTGGIGSGETAEGFGPDYSLRNRAYNESCSTCGLIYYLWKMNLAWHESKYADLFEDSLYNALLGSIDLEGKHFYYDNPLDERTPRYQWHICPCCVGNIPRTLLMLPTWMYASSPDSLYVNLYIGSAMTLENVAGTNIEVVQETDYPWGGKVALTLHPKASKRFALRLRVPNRSVSELYKTAPEPAGIGAILINGKPVMTQFEKGYAVINRAWKAGDRVEFELPMKPQRIHGIDKIEATRGKVALRYGPLIYNFESEDQDITKSLAPGSPLATEFRRDFLGGVMVIKGQFADGSPMLAIPNYARMNRKPGIPLPRQAPPPGPDGKRPAPPPPSSIVWIREA
jgi:hypothetical protein